MDFLFGGAKKKKTIRKHKGVNQQTGRLNKGYKYSGKTLKSGVKQIVKVQTRKTKTQKGGGKTKSWFNFIF